MTKLRKNTCVKNNIHILLGKKFIFNAKNTKKNIDVAMKNYSNIQILFKIKLKYQFWIMIVIIKLNIQNHVIFSQLYKLVLTIKIIF